MTKLSAILGTAAFIGAVALSAGSAFAVPTPGFLPFGSDLGPGTLITVGPSGATVTFTGEPPYDGIEDTYVGVINNSGHALTGLHLTSNTDIFGFDGDGINLYGAPSNLLDTSGIPFGCGTPACAYGGPNAYFTNINLALTAGDVHFITPIADGGQDYFSLEESLSNASGFTVTGVPEPISLSLFGAGLVGIAARRRKAKKA